MLVGWFIYFFFVCYVFLLGLWVFLGVVPIFWLCDFMISQRSYDFMALFCFFRVIGNFWFMVRFLVIFYNTCSWISSSTILWFFGCVKFLLVWFIMWLFGFKFFFIVHKHSLGSCEVPQKSWARSVQPFWLLLDTKKPDRQTNRQASIYIDNEF